MAPQGYPLIEISPIAANTAQSHIPGACGLHHPIHQNTRVVVRAPLACSSQSDISILDCTVLPANPYPLIATRPISPCPGDGDSPVPRR